MIILDVEKQPSERKDYDVTGADWLVAGDSIVSATASVVCLTNALDTALIVESPVVISNPVMKVWVTAGTNLYKYKITILATTLDGRIVECEIIIRVKDR